MIMLAYSVFFREARTLVCMTHSHTFTHTHTGTVPVSDHFGGINIKSGNQLVFFTNSLFLERSSWLPIDCGLKTTLSELCFLS